MHLQTSQLLEGIRVVDLSRGLAGPFCTRLMADLGAEVIKIEPPGGDQTRTFERTRDNRSGYFIQQNVSKQGIAIDLRKPEGKQVVLDLISIADVVVENYRPGVMARLGINYDSLCKINPTIVMCSISAFGQYGPYSQLRGGDYNIQALSGMMWINGEKDGPPMWTGNAYCDTAAGNHAFGGIVAALFRRIQLGRSEHIDISLLDCAIYQQEQIFQQYLVSEGEVEPHRMGSSRPENVPVNVYRGKDAYLVLAAMSDTAWDLLVDTMELPGLGGDKRFSSRALRVENRFELDKIIEEWVQSFGSTDQVINLLESKGLVCGRVRSIPEVLNDPHIAEREMVLPVTDPGIGKEISVLNSPLRFHDTSSRLRGPAPLFGQHTAEVLGELLGYNRPRVLSLIGEGIAQMEESVVSETLQALDDVG